MSNFVNSIVLTRNLMSVIDQTRLAKSLQAPRIKFSWKILIVLSATLLQYWNIYSPTKAKHHLTCFNNKFSNNELISNQFAVFATFTHILTYLWNRLLIDFYLCVYDRVCKVPCVLFNICVCERKLIFFV